MKKWGIGIILCILMLLPGYRELQAQQFQNRGWIYLSHTSQLKGPLSFFGELQLRSADKWEYLNTTLIRSGLIYELHQDRQVAGLGYTYKGDKEPGDVDPDLFEYTREHRIYEEYIYKAPAGNTTLQVRGRLEQRFITRPGDLQIFSQRFRMLASVEIPWGRQTKPDQGFFSVFQDELMLTVQNSQELSGGLFDQNRLYGSAGYRFSEALAVEAGYYYWLQQEKAGMDHKNVYQLKITTDL